VLPLVNESSGKNQQYFSDGLSDEMISALAGEDGFALHAGRHCQP
jgi:TolB-like protein